MSSNGEPAKALVTDAIRELGKFIFTEEFALRHSAHLDSVPRFYAAVFAVLENAVSFYVDRQLQIMRKPEFLISVRSEFAMAASRLSFSEIISLGDIVSAPFEIESVEKNFRRIGRRESMETLMMFPSSFGSHYQTIQDIRCAEFIGFLVGNGGEDLEEALARSFAFWFFGKSSIEPGEVGLVDEIADNTHWIAALVVNRA